MQCRNCGAEIADKALICYRCGTATTDAKYQPAAPRARRSSSSLVVSTIALALLVVLALYMGRTPSGDTPRLVTWIAVALAVVLVAVRAYLRRRR
jgi:uncharacterized membrane protein YvbJ